MKNSYANLPESKLLIKSYMLEMMSQKGEELTPEQKATLESIEADKPKVDPTPPVVPVVEPKVEPAKVETPEKKEVMPLTDPDVEEDDKTTDGRQPKFVRLEKHLKMRDKVKELEAELTTLKTQPQTPASQAKQDEVIDEVKAFAESNGYDAEQTQKLIDLAEKGAYNRLKKEFDGQFNQLNEVAEKAKRENEELGQQKIWNKQYGELLEKYSNEKDHIESIKGTIQKLAYSKEFHQAPLTAVYAYLKEVEGLKPADRSKTVESGTGGQNKGGIDFERILADNDQDAIKAMSSEDFDGLQKYIKSHNL